MSLKPFLGSCKVCGHKSLNYRSLSNHLRHNRSDPAHAELEKEWKAWRASQYSREKKCRKCGDTWEVRDKTQKDLKICPSCRHLKAHIGKRAYEKRPTAPYSGVPKKISLRESVETSVGVGPLLLSGLTVRAILKRTGLSYAAFRKRAEYELGKSVYSELMAQRKVATGSQNVKASHRWYTSLTPEDKATLLKKRFGGTCALEASLSKQLEEYGLPLVLNQWQSVRLKGTHCPREVDIKVNLPDGRKVAIFCDGEAFHGYGAIYGDPAERVADDVATATAFFELGYSALRYSESEVQSGWARAHFQQVLQDLHTSRKVLRFWHEESYVQAA